MGFLSKFLKHGRGLIASALFVGLTGFAPAAAQDAVSPEQLRSFAIAALDAGQPEVAENAAKLLLVRDLGDASARLILAEAHVAQGDYAQGRAEAARVWRESSDPEARYVAARLIAIGHRRDDNTLRSQFWLRRAIQTAPTDDARATAVNSFRAIRRASPWSARLSFGLSPVSNINNGSVSGILRLPGVPLDLVTTQALAGTELSFGIDGTYRVAQSSGSVTYLTGQFSLRRYRFNAESEAAGEEALPNPVFASDFSYTALGLGVRHIRRAGEGRLTLAADLNEIHYGGDPYSRGVSLSADLRRGLGDGKRLSYGATVGRQWSLRDAPISSSVAVRTSYTLPAGPGQLRLSLGARRNFSEQASSDYSSLTAGADYDFRRPILGATVSLGLDLEARHFGFSGLSASGERDDRTVAVSATFGFPDLEYLGFTPTLTATARRTASNVSAYETESLRLQAGFRSSF